MLGRQLYADVFSFIHAFGTLQSLFPNLVFNISVGFLLHSSRSVAREELEIVAMLEEPRGEHST
jgi:hypothetical protein